MASILLLNFTKSSSLLNHVSHHLVQRQRIPSHLSLFCSKKINLLSSLSVLLIFSSDFRSTPAAWMMSVVKADETQQNQFNCVPS